MHAKSLRRDAPNARLFCRSGARRDQRHRHPGIAHKCAPTRAIYRAFVGASLLAKRLRHDAPDARLFGSSGARRDQRHRHPGKVHRHRRGSKGIDMSAQGGYGRGKAKALVDIQQLVGGHGRVFERRTCIADGLADSDRVQVIGMFEKFIRMLCR